MGHLYKEQRSEGIVLRSALFKEHDRIITVFMQEAGVVSLMVKKAHHHRALTSPFCQGEFLYVKGKSDLYQFRDGTVLEEHYALRNSLSHLSSAGEMVQAILHSQLPGKAAPNLYALLAACMKKIPLFDHPFRLITSFRLKLLTHEGVLSWEDASHFPIVLTSSEWEVLKETAEARSFQKIQQIPLSKELSLKIQNNFKELL